MFCSNICLVGIAFIIAQFIMLFSMTFNNKEHIILNNSLDEAQKGVYKKIVSKRRQIYIKGYLLGIVLSMIVILLNYYYFKKDKLGALCIGIVISVLTTYFFYILSPKSKYMLEVLETREQINNWLKIYKSMKFKFHLSFLLGLIASFLIQYSVC